MTMLHPYIYPDGYLPLYESFVARGIEFDVEDERLGQARAMPAAS